MFLLRKFVVAVAVASVALTGLVVIGAPAHAQNCRQSSLYPTDIYGNKNFNCSNGSYSLKKPFGSNDWRNPMSTYELKPNRGGSSQRCRYNSLFNRYDCR